MFNVLYFYNITTRLEYFIDFDIIRDYKKLYLTLRVYKTC